MQAKPVEQAAGGVDLAIVAAEIAGVVIGHAHLAERYANAEPARGHQFIEEGGVVHHLIVAAERRIFVAQGVQSMRVGGEDAREGVARQGGDVVAGEALEGGLIPEPAGEVAAVALFLAKHGEVDAGLVQQGDKGAQRAAIAQLARRLRRATAELRRGLRGDQRQGKPGGEVCPGTPGGRPPGSSA